MKTPRTQEELLKRIEERNNDFMGYIANDTIHYLDFDNVNKFLKDAYSKYEWGICQKTEVLDYPLKYMIFAWEKANNCRGISSSRSVAHYKSWIWIAGIDDFDDIADREYKFYGKPVLVILCVALGIDWKSLDNGEWVNSENDENEYPSESEIERLTSIGENLKLKIQEISK